MTSTIQFFMLQECLVLWLKSLSKTPTKMVGADVWKKLCIIYTRRTQERHCLGVNQNFIKDAMQLFQKDQSIVERQSVGKS
jgi:hypothetical protein